MKRIPAQNSRQKKTVARSSAAEGGERALISAIRSRAGAATRSLRLGIGDDCAILRPPAGHEIVVTTDFSLEQVHFRRDWHPPESVGHRCLARGLSDLAAMGAQPLGAFLSLALPAELTTKESGWSWIDRFMDGLLALADKAQVPLAGGDTAQSPEFDAHGHKQSGLAATDIVLIGAVKRGRALLRSEARVGDTIYVTGHLGGAAAELLALGRNPEKFAALTKAAAGHPHLYPDPRIAPAKKLAATGKIHAGIDISDGLSTDLGHICEESGVAAELDGAAIPIDPLAVHAEREGWVPSAMALALHGGEDYELLFTAPRRARIPLRIGGVPVRAIGQIVERKRRQPLVTLRSGDGKTSAIESGGWEHFSKD
jgi:thiamine-monophosphate kinase